MSGNPFPVATLHEISFDTTNLPSISINLAFLDTIRMVSIDKIQDYSPKTINNSIRCGGVEKLLGTSDRAQKSLMHSSR